ncbi:MAG: hypothetical protein M0P47_09075 [Bacteroidales bacterium]|nr:hypothetical protein [Bacteroidales bacterium]
MISRPLLHEISLKIAHLRGWDFNQNKFRDLKRGLLSTARELGIDENPADIEKWLKTSTWSKKELDILTTHLTVGETYFFREKALLEVFQKQILAEFIRERIQKNQTLRIWSAGCCSGEEPYSLAILLRESLPDIKNWKVTILATDINQVFLTKAKSGIYTSWSFRETPPSIKNRYFTPNGNTWHINPEIKEMVTFALLNLADGQYPSAITDTQNMDIIFCRNVLMYFTPVQIRLVAKRFYQSLLEKGWLITSAVELNDDYFGDFNAIKFGNNVVYRKTPKTDPQQPGSIPIKKETPLIKTKAKSQKRPVLPDKNEHPVPEKEAELLLQQGKYEKCALACESILKIEPENHAILMMLVRSKANLGLLKDARNWIEQLLKHPKVNADHFYLYANILLEGNELELAESILKRALYLDPNHLMSHFLLGNLAVKANNIRMAKKHFQNVNELLAHFEEEEMVPGSDGLTAGRIQKLISKLT